MSSANRPDPSSPLIGGYFLANDFTLTDKLTNKFPDMGESKKNWQFLVNFTDELPLIPDFIP